MALCGNTCAAASNGVCDEGRLDSYAAVRLAAFATAVDHVYSSTWWSMPPAVDQHLDQTRTPATEDFASEAHLEHHLEGSTGHLSMHQSMMFLSYQECVLRRCHQQGCRCCAIPARTAPTAGRSGSTPRPPPRPVSRRTCRSGGSAHSRCSCIPALAAHSTLPAAGMSCQVILSSRRRCRQKDNCVLTVPCAQGGRSL